MAMRYCINCGSEYEDSVRECTDCPGSALVDAAAMRQAGVPLAGERDRRTFVRVGSAEDLLSADDYVQVLEEARIPVISRAHRGGTVDALTTGLVMDWWEILVPEEHVAQATALLARERATLEATAEEAALAAEEEELEMESAAAAPPAGP
jgi:hypothetical protein